MNTDVGTAVRTIMDALATRPVVLVDFKIPWFKTEPNKLDVFDCLVVYNRAIGDVLFQGFAVSEVVKVASRR